MTSSPTRLATARLLVGALVAAATCLPGSRLDAALRNIPPVPDERHVLAIVDVSVLSMLGDGVDPHRTVVIRGQRIESIGPSSSVTAPPSAQIIDGRGKFLMPGLSDMHAHVRRKKGQEPPDYLEQGITVVRNMAGDAGHLAFAERVRSGELAGPLLSTTGPPLTSSELFPSHRLVTTAEEGRQAVRDSVEAGYDYIKVYSLLSLEAFQGIAKEARALGVPLVGHVSDEVRLWPAIQAGQTSIEHFFGYFWELEAEDSDLDGRWHPRRLFHAVEIDESRLAAVAEKTARLGVWNCPTLWRKDNDLTFPPAEEFWKDPTMQELAHHNRALLLKALHDAGAGLLTGTDDRAEVIHAELELFVEAGLTPYQALRASTVGAAESLDATADHGTVQEGRLANLVLLEANPLQDIRNTRSIEGIAMRGAWVPLEK